MRDPFTILRCTPKLLAVSFNGDCGKLKSNRWRRKNTLYLSGEQMFVSIAQVRAVLVAGSRLLQTSDSWLVFRGTINGVLQSVIRRAVMATKLPGFITSVIADFMSHFLSFSHNTNYCYCVDQNYYHTPHHSDLLQLILFFLMVCFKISKTKLLMMYLSPKLKHINFIYR